MQQLPSAAGSSASTALDINRKGQVVGTAQFTDADGMPVWHAVLWDDSRGCDLNSLLPAGSGWLLESATSINQHGDVVGTGIHNGEQRAFMVRVSSDTAENCQPAVAGRQRLGM
jgi:probable HAF family extracellular repeat protein